MNKFKITKEDEGKRLDVFLKEKYPDLSRSFLQKKIKAGSVFVGSDKAAVHRFLKEGDVVEILTPLNPPWAMGEREGIPKALAKQSLNLLLSKDKIKLNIIYETKDYLVMNKPCGLIVHPGILGEENTLAHILWNKYPELKNIGEYPERPGIVHRLDKDVSGIMVVAKTQEMFSHLKNQFQERTIKKEYIALVYGLVEQPSGIIDFPIGRSRTNGTKMAARPLNQGGREAITEFTVLKHFAKWTILKIKIETGRMHQIRVHLNAYGHPVVGDRIYKPRKLKETLKFGSRLFLHAWNLGFEDLKGEWKQFEAKLPDEFSVLLA